MEFSGGLELLFDKKKSHEIELPQDSIPLKDLLQWLKGNLLKERPELFLTGENVRPGILVLINDCDWELVGGIDYTVQPKDSIVFISTLHGG